MSSKTAIMLLIICIGVLLGVVARWQIQQKVPKGRALENRTLEERALSVLDELVTFPAGRGGFTAVRPAIQRLGISRRDSLAVSQYLRDHGLIEARSPNAGLHDEVRLTATGNREIQRRQKVATGDVGSTPVYHITNYGSMVSARDIRGGAVNAGSVMGDITSGISTEHMLDLVAALRSDLQNVTDQDLKREATACAQAMDIEATVEDEGSEARRRSLIDRVTGVVGLAQGAFTLTMEVLQAFS